MRSNRTKARTRRRGLNWRTALLAFVCAVITVCGIFLAGRQHFSSIDFGMKNSRLRKQVDDLEAEKRRLLLAREVSLSPSEIKKAAKRAGLIAPAGKPEGEIAQVVSTSKDKALPPATSDAKSMIIRTASVTPAQATAAVYPKTTKPDTSKPTKSAKSKVSMINN